MSNTEFHLTGMRPDIPLAAMAAFGVLRIASRDPEEYGEVALSWSDDGRPDGSGESHPVLHLSRALTREQLVASFVARLVDASQREELTWSSSIDVVEFRRAVDAGLDPEWAPAFATDLFEPTHKGAKRTTFDTTAGQQGFLALACEAARALDPKLFKGRKGQKSPQEAFEEALFGPWRYEDDQHSLGWDPLTNRLGAFTRMAPTKMKNKGVRAAFWLAVESLPLFPCFVTSYLYFHRLETTAFDYSKRQREFRWPVWTEPLNLDELRSLLGQMRSPQTLWPRGVRQVYGSNRVEPNDRYGCFLPARLLTEVTEQ